MRTRSRITLNEEKLAKAQNAENPSNANILIPKRGQLAIVSEKEIHSNRIQRNYLQRTISSSPKPSTIPPNKVIPSAVIRKRIDELSVQQMAVNESTVDERLNKLPYINQSHNEIMDDVVYDDPEILLDSGDNLDESYDGLDMDLIERDIHIFDNYNNISSSHQR